MELKVKINKKALLASVLALVLSACGGDSKSSDKATKSNAAPELNAAENTQLSGTTWSNCSDDSIKARYYFQDNNFSYTLEYFDAPDCQGEIFNEEFYLYGNAGDTYVDNNNFEWNGEFAIGTITTTESGLNARKIDFKYSGIERYDIFYIQDDNLYFGLSNGTFEGDRDTEIDFETPWIQEIN